MAFRDDRDALRAKAEAARREAEELQSELAEAKAALAAQTAKDVRDERELERLRAQVERLGGPPRQPKAHPNRPMYIALGVGLVVAIGAGTALFARGDKAAVDRVPVGGVPPAEQHIAGGPEASPAPVQPSVVRLPGIVVRSDGASQLAGRGCIVEATLTEGPAIRSVSVYCDGLLYEPGQSSGTGMTLRDSSVVEATSDPGAWRYRLSYQDTGERTGPRPQVRLDSARHALRVWRESEDPFDLEIFVDEWSSVRRGEALSSGEERFAPLDPVRRVARSSERDADCELSIDPWIAGHDLNCRVVLRCGDELVYGEALSGMCACTSADGRILQAEDGSTTAEDGDPAVVVDLDAGTLELSDVVQGDAVAESFQLSVPTDERCALEGRWEGAYTYQGTTYPGLSLDSGNMTVRGAAGGGWMNSVHSRAVCGENAALLTAIDRNYAGTFGPGFQTFVALQVETDDSFWFRRIER